jgi:nucleotide-binding universal stress UspA family protein
LIRVNNPSSVSVVIKQEQPEEGVMFKSIVVAFDGSDYANRALEIASSLAEQGQASLGIIYVIDSSHMKIPDEMRRMGEVEHIIEPMPRLLVNFEQAPLDLVNTLSQTSSDSEKALLEFGKFLATQAAENAREAGVEKVEYKVALGDVVEEIVNFAVNRKADLIVTGSRGFGKLKGLLLGSTSSKLIQLAQCSCLTVK